MQTFTGKNSISCRLFAFLFSQDLNLLPGKRFSSTCSGKKGKSTFYRAVHRHIGIKEIYPEPGFANHSVFNKTVEKYYGIPPSGFRKPAPEIFPFENYSF